MSRSSSVLLIFFLLSTVVCSQVLNNEDAKWGSGAVELVDGKTFHTELRYFSSNQFDILQARESKVGEVFSFSADKVNKFYYYDSLFGYDRKLVSLEFNNRFRFFEAIYEGEFLSIYRIAQLRWRHERMVYDESEYCPVFNCRKIHGHHKNERFDYQVGVIAEELFIGGEEKDLVKLSDYTAMYSQETLIKGLRVKKLWVFVNDTRLELKSYIKSNSLDLNNRNDLINFIAKYNKLKIQRASL